VKCEAIRRTVLYVFCICSSLFPVSCSLTRATNNSLQFIREPAFTSTSYRLVGHGVNKIFSTPIITVNGLTPGLCYTFTLWPVLHVGDGTGPLPGPEYLSNSNTCTGCTSMLRFVLSFHSGNF